MPEPEAEQVKTISAPTPVFPDEAKDPIYGDSIRVSMDIDKKGLVTDARVFGPMAPCSNLEDPVAAAVNAAALAAAKATVFEPILKNGKPVEAKLSVSFRLRPRPSAQPEDGRKMIRGGVLNDKALSLPQPYYPLISLSNRLRASVSVSVLIDEEGRVTPAGAMAGHPDFIPASVEAACAARFSRTLLSGQPVKVSGVITYNFGPR